MKEELQNGSRWIEIEEALEIADRVLAGEYDRLNLASLLISLNFAGGRAMSKEILEPVRQVGMGAS